LKNHRAYYWLGLGSGLIIGALLMQLMTFRSPYDGLDRSELEQAAARHGYRLVRENETVQLDDDRSLRAIYVMPGMSLEQIADLLASAKLIDRPELFLQAVDQWPDAVRIRSGYHVFRGAPTIAELIEQLTNDPA